MDEVLLADDELALEIKRDLHVAGWNHKPSAPVPISVDACRWSGMLWSRWADRLQREFEPPCRSMLRCEYLEVSHEAYMRFLRALLTWEPNRASPTRDSSFALVVTIYRNLIRDLARRAWTRRTEPLADVTGVLEPNLVEESDRLAALKEAVARIIDSLPTSMERFIAERHWFAGVPVSVLVQLTGWNRDEIKRAIRRVRKCFEDAFVERYPDLVELIAPEWQAQRHGL